MDFNFFSFCFQERSFQSLLFTQVKEGRDFIIPSNSFKVGPVTGLFLQKMEKEGFSPVVVIDSKRDFFSVEGKVIALGKDNVTIFEYLDKDTAHFEAEEFEKSSKTSLGAWKKNVHIYVDGNIIIFYMGEKVGIINSLNNTVGRFVAANQ